MMYPVKIVGSTCILLLHGRDGKLLKPVNIWEADDD
jgi:hypothetical protein